MIILIFRLRAKQVKSVEFCSFFLPLFFIIIILLFSSSVFGQRPDANVFFLENPWGW